MSYLRPLILQPPSLKQSAIDSWLQYLLSIIRENQIICRSRPGLQTPDESITCQDALGSYFRFNGRYICFNSNELYGYLDKLVPKTIQEEGFHRGCQMIRKELFFLDTFPLFLRLVWRPQFHHLDLPPIADGENRVAVLNFLTRCYEETENCMESAKFRLFETSELHIEESYLMKRVLRTLTNIRVLVMWWAADDAMLNILGSTCQHLESVDVWRSSSVTDLGIKMLCFTDDDAYYDEKSPVCHSLLRLGLKETSVTHMGCLIALMRCSNLEVLNFTHTSILKDFMKELNQLNLKGKSKLIFSLKTLFLPIETAQGFSDIVKIFPNLEDLRIWTSMGQFRNLESSDLVQLKSLLLGGLQNARIMNGFVTQVGSRLTTLKLETTLMDIPLQDIGIHCPNLVELQITNGRLSIQDHVCKDVSSSAFFSKLKLLHLFLVQYIPTQQINDENQNPQIQSSEPIGDGPPTALHCILRHAKALEGLQVIGCPMFDDASLKDTLATNPLKHIRRFIISDATLKNEPRGISLALNSDSVYRLFNNCHNLQCIGNLRHWNISPSQRRDISKTIQEKTGRKWISTASH